MRLSRLIDNVLDFAKIERGVDVYEFAEDQDLGEVVRRALESQPHRLEQAEMELDVDLADDLPPMRIDENAMTLALLNLVDNAIKYAADGKRIEVSLRAGATPASRWWCATAGPASRPTSTADLRALLSGARGAPKPSAAAASAWRWSSTSPRPTAARSACERARTARARSSACGSPRPLVRRRPGTVQVPPR